MQTKKILRFYFSADSLEKAFDNLIINKACAPYSDSLETAEAICSVIGDKIQLERLWTYLDGVLSTFTKEEREILSDYSAQCVRQNDYKAVKRAVIKFTRRARRLEEFGGDILVLNKYFCLIRA